MNYNVIKGIILVAVIVYVLCPDPVPGPVDDIIVTLFGLAIRRGISMKQEQNLAERDLY